MVKKAREHEEQRMKTHLYHQKASKAKNCRQPNTKEQIKLAPYLPEPHLDCLDRIVNRM
jgi:hypothetical protein